MIFRQLDNQHDWLFGKGTSDYLTGDAAIRLNIKTRLLSWVGDCFFALQEGIDWKGRLDVGQQKALTEEVKSSLLRSFGVVGVNTVSVAFQTGTRLFTITYDIQTIYSPSFQSFIQGTVGG